MFTFHEADAPPKPSEHLEVTSPTSSTPPPPSAQSLDAQALDDGSDGAVQSTAQSQQPVCSKRNSVFTLRARSNTATSSTSTLSLIASNPSDMTSANPSRPMTPATFQSYSITSTTSSESGSKKSFLRGRRGRRSSDAVPPSIQTTEYEEADAGNKRNSVLRKVRKRSMHSQTPSSVLKERISSPFGFQHVSHAGRENLTSIEASLGDKLGVAYRVHASSAPSLADANATEAHNLKITKLAAEILAAQNPTPPSAQSSQSPQEVENLQQPLRSPDQTQTQPLRLTRSVESFSQPGINLRNHRYSQSIAVPPPLSSQSRSRRGSGVWDAFSIADPGAEQYSPDSTGDLTYFGHALTTPDDTAIQAMTPPSSFSPSLDDVAEEPERFVRPRPAPLPPMTSPMSPRSPRFVRPRPAPLPPTRSPTSPRSPRFDSSIFLVQRSPATRRRLRANSQVSPRSHSHRASIVSQASDTLGGLDSGLRPSVKRSREHRRPSHTWRVPEESWEDDIDFAYEHAMEADCDFDWDCVPTDTQCAYPQPATALQPAFESSIRHPECNFRDSLLLPSPSSVPDLEPTSATSAHTSETALATPCEPFARVSAIVMGGFSLGPSPLIPQDYKHDKQPTYEELLNEYADSERNFTGLGLRHSATSSARSRRSSYDSSLISSAQSSDMWSSPIRRPASSAGSVPELVPSRRSRRDVTSSSVVDQIVDSIASLSYHDEKEDSDVTTPGRDISNKTFFSSGDLSSGEDTEATATVHPSVENEVRASLELARHGSKRIGRPTESAVMDGKPSSRHHKHAMSDGAAKLLTMEGHRTKPRSRAATISQTARSPKLSLFPAPSRIPSTSNRV